MSVNQFLRLFFEEKNLPEVVFEVQHKEDIHFVENGFVIDLILNHSSEEEQNKIRDIISQIDFRNGNVNHFLEHLAKGYVTTNH